MEMFSCGRGTWARSWTGSGTDRLVADNELPARVSLSIGATEVSRDDWATVTQNLRAMLAQMQDDNERGETT